MDNQEKIAIVTGGSRGIGRGVVEALLEAGWRVRFCSRSPESVQRTQAELAARFGDAVRGRAVDVRNQEEVDAFVREESRIDCLVNNAGLGIFGPVDELTGDQWREVIETNLSGCFYFLRAVAPVMKRQGSGWIFNVASLAGKHAMAGGAAYNASKFGLLGFSEAMMLDVREHGIRVCCVMPGSVNTYFNDKDPSPENGWMIQPQDIARIVMDLLAFPENALPSRIEVRPTCPRSR